jgi:hypothetical protein
MSAAFALFTSDPNLLGCVLHRLEGQVSLAGSESLNAAGVGSYALDDVLLRRYSQGRLPRTLQDLLPHEKSEALLYRGQVLPLGMSPESGQPLRYREWLFCQLGTVHAFAELKPKLEAELPDYLQRTPGHATEGEVAFALFLKYLREAERADDRTLEPSLIAQMLGQASRRIQQLSTAAGAARLSSINLIASNQQALVATRLGETPLHYTLLEGSERCDVCGLTAATPSTAPKIRAHLRQRTVAVASHVAQPAGWVELPSGSALAVDWKRGVRVEAF